MTNKISVLVAGRSPPLCEATRAMLDGHPEISVRLQVANEAQRDPLSGQNTAPDVLVICLSGEWEEELRALSPRTGLAGPPLIAIAPSADPAIMRRAMQSGARDFFAPPVHRDDLLQSVRRMVSERGAPMEKDRGDVIAVINAKGGSGASTLAGNVAHLLATLHGRSTCLIDLDLQFGALALAFDMQLTNSLLDAINATDPVDAAALQGYVARHASGLHVLGTTAEQLPQPWKLAPQSLGHILDVACETYDHVVVDLPRHIDPLTSVVLENASRVLVVMQQSLAHVRDAKTMLRVLTTDLAVPREHILLVVNRHSDRNPIHLHDIQEAVQPAAWLALPNDFLRVSEALDTGLPLYDSARTAPITRALIDLAARLASGAPAQGDQAETKRAGLRGALSVAFGRARTGT